MARQIHLGAFVMTDGHHVAAWRHPSTRPDASVRLEHFVHIAKVAERGRFDALFLADGNGVRERNPEALARISRSVSFEPITLLAALATVTEKLGLVATASTSFNEPFHIARKFASLDLLTQGRAGWNLVTSNSDAEALNFGLDRHLDHAERYDRAREFADVVQGLWRSYEADAFPRDAQSGLFLDLEKLHVLNHQGRHFKVRGPLNVPPSPQGRPVIVQAGSSEEGRGLAAETADLVFTAQQTLEDARAFRADIRARAAAAGRDPDSVKVLPGIQPFIGETSDAAAAHYEELQQLIHPAVAIHLLGHAIGGFDLSAYPIDGPVPDLPLTNGPRSRQRLLLDMARRENLTLRQLALKVAGGRGHWQVVGTADEIADRMESWFLAGAADGFNVMPPVLPKGLEDFVDAVIPALRRRGLFREDYAGSTLRHHLALPH